MKKLIFILALCLLGNTFGVYTTSDIDLDTVGNPDQLTTMLIDLFANQTSDSFLFTPRSTAPAGTLSAEGRMYYDSVSNTIQLHTGSGFVPMDTAGGVSLDSAYNFGSAGGGRAIGVTDGAITMTKDDGGTENVLEISASPSGSADGDGILVTLGTNATGVGIQFALGVGATNDLAGTSDSWTISKAGAFAGVGGTWTGDHLFTGSSKNIEVDVSQDAIHFLDDAKLAIGGVTTAAGDFVFSYDGTDFNLEAAAANDDFRMGETTHFDLSIHGQTNTNVVKFDTDDSALLCIFDGFDLRMNDDDVLIFGDSVASDSFSVNFDETTDNLLIVANTANDQVQFGDGTSSSTDVKMMASTNGDFVLFDSSGDELFFEDADLKLNEGAQIEFADSGDAVDWTIDVATGEKLLFTPSEIDGTSTFNIGDATNTADVRIFGETASTVVFDATGDEVLFNAYDISMGDDDIIRLGDGDDITIAATGTTTTMTIAAGSVLTIADTDNSASLLTFGVSGGTHGLDVLFQGSTAGDIVDWDAGADTWNFGVDATGVDVVFHSDTTLKLMKWVEATSILSLDGATAMLEFRGANVDAHETTLAVVEPTKSNIVNLPDDTGELSYIAEGGTVAFGPTGAIPLTDAVVLWTSTGADAISLPDGTSAGQILSIVLVAQAGGNGTLTPDSVTGSGWATMVFTNIGESATFLYVDSTIGWLCLGTFGVTTQPLITQ